MVKPPVTKPPAVKPATFPVGVMTEAEAAEVWCPMTPRHYTDEDRIALVTSSLCIGSACILWRAHEEDADFGWCGLGGQPS
jgi:hypothetical protein